MDVARTDQLLSERCEHLEGLASVWFWCTCSLIELASLLILTIKQKCRTSLTKLSTVKSTKTTTMSTDTCCYHGTSTSKCLMGDYCLSRSGARLVFSSQEGGFTTRFTHQNLSFCCSEGLLLLILRQEWFRLATRSTKSTRICSTTPTTTEDQLMPWQFLNAEEAAVSEHSRKFIIVQVGVIP